MSDLRDLAARVRGPVTLPGDVGYDAARALWSVRVERRPAAIVRCDNPDDIAAALEHARTHGLPVSVRSGGHHVAAAALCDDGLVIDLSAFDDVEVDAGARVARVGPAARVRDLDRAAQAHGLMTTGAAITTVGLGGYTLGGGLGWTSRLHGLACDNLLAARVVTVDGRTLRASNDENPDLFWALRGGGGAFAVVTSLELRLHPMGPDVLAGPILHPISAASDLLRAWRDIMLDAPDPLQCMPVISAAPPEPGSGNTQGDTLLALFPIWAGDPATGEPHVARFRELGSPIADQVTVSPYAHLLDDLDDMFRAGHRNYYRSAFVDSFDDAAIDAFCTRIAPVPTPFSSAFLEPMGGAIARVAPDATAFPHRQRRFCITAVPKWEHADLDDRMMTWADAAIDALRPWADAGVYVNYLDVFGSPEQAWGPNLPRLREIRQHWDPHRLLRGHPSM